MSNASAFPRLSDDGRDLVAGHAEIWINDAVRVGPGTSPQWADDGSIYYARQPDGALMRRFPDGRVEPVRGHAFNGFTVGGADRWAGWNMLGPGGAVQTVFSNGTIVPGWSGPALSRDPGVWAAIEHATGRLITHAGVPLRYAESGCREPRWCGRALVWNVHHDGRWQIAGMREPGTTPELLNVEREEFWPVPLLIGGELWLMTHSHNRLMLRPWRDTTGYVVARGTTNWPDAKQNGQTTNVRVVWDALRNTLLEEDVDVSAPRVDLRLQPPADPIPDTSGRLIDIFPYIIPQPGRFPRTSHLEGHGHEMDVRREGNSLYELRFGEPDHWVRLDIVNQNGVEGIALIEDRSRDGQSTGDYSITDGRWARRHMRVGEVIDHPDNVLVRYNPDTCEIVDVHRLPYRSSLYAAYLSYDCGGSIGVQPVIVMNTDGGGLEDTYELGYFALGWGFFKWEEYDQRTGAIRHWTIFNELGGRSPAITRGCWRPEHLALRPETWRNVSMTIAEFNANPTGNTSRAVCAPDRGDSWAPWVEWIWRRVGESAWRQQGERRNPRDDNDHTFQFPGPGRYEIGLRWERGQTGLQRVVTVPEPEPIPEPEPSFPVTSLRIHGRWLSADLTRPIAGGHEVVANRDEAGAWEQFQVVPVEGGIALRAQSNGKYLCADLDMGARLLANRDAAGTWETFIPERVDGGFALKAVANGNYLSADPSLPNIPPGATRRGEDGPLSWETFESTIALVAGGGPAPEAPLDLISEQLQIVGGGGFITAGRPALPILWHWGDVFSLVAHGHIGIAERIMANGRRAGFHGFRGWPTLGLDDRGGGFWAGRQVGPTYENVYGLGYDAWERVVADVFTLAADHGMGMQISQGDVRRVAIPDRREYAHRLGNLINRLDPRRVLLWEAANESRDTGEPDAGRLAEFARWFQEVCPAPLIGLSAYTGTEDVEILNNFSRDPADVFMCHGYRGGRWWDKVRHVFSLVYEGRPARRLGWQGEPAGPGHWVSAIDNKHELDAAWGQLMACMSLMTRQAFVWFSGPGVISDHPERIEDMPGFWDVAHVRGLLPADLMWYSRLFHGGETWRNIRVFRAEGEVRADHAMHDDGRFVCLIYGPGSLDLQQSRQAEIVRDVRFGDRGRLVVGRAL